MSKNKKKKKRVIDLRKFIQNGKSSGFAKDKSYSGMPGDYYFEDIADTESLPEEDDIY